MEFFDIFKFDSTWIEVTWSGKSQINQHPWWVTHLLNSVLSEHVACNLINSLICPLKTFLFARLIQTSEANHLKVLKIDLLLSIWIFKSDRSKSIQNWFKSSMVCRSGSIHESTTNSAVKFSKSETEAWKESPLSSRDWMIKILWYDSYQIKFPIMNNTPVIWSRELSASFAVQFSLNCLPRH